MPFQQAGFLPLFDQPTFSAFFQVTQRCNFNCPYCVNRELRKAGLHMCPEIMRLALKYTRNVPAENFKFSISGGEPSLWPWLEDMLEKIARDFPAGTAVNILSNGSFTVNHIRRLQERCANLKLRFIFTIHPLQSDISALLKKMDSFSAREARHLFHLKMVMPPATSPAYEKAVNILNAIEGHGLKCALHAELDFASGSINPAYTPAELDFIEVSHKNAWFQYAHVDEKASMQVNFQEGLRKNFFHYKGMNCAAGRSSIYIDEQGNVSRGQFCGRMNYSILDKNPFMDPDFLKPGKCAENHCVCMPFTALPKWASEEFAPRWLKE